MRILVIDNYDSFVYNLVQYLAQLGADCVVRRNDVVELPEVDEVDGVLLSPGPGTPERAGNTIAAIKRCAELGKPALGVCLGHQAMGVAWGATVSRAPELLHGKTSKVQHSDSDIFVGLPNPFTATRYHSLAVEADTIPAEFEITAQTDSGVVMGMRHRDLPIYGVQFHPESVLTEGGHRMLANWMALAGYPVLPATVDALELAVQRVAAAAI